MLTLFPRGTIHFAQNLGCKMATLADASGNEDGGLTTIHSDSFLLPNDILGTAFALNETTIESIRNALPPTVAGGTDKCLKACGLYK